jgi:hypothetical protein
MARRSLLGFGSVICRTSCEQQANISWHEQGAHQVDDEGEPALFSVSSWHS